MSGRGGDGGESGDDDLLRSLDLSRTCLSLLVVDCLDLPCTHKCTRIAYMNVLYRIGSGKHSLIYTTLCKLHRHIDNWSVAWTSQRTHSRSYTTHTAMSDKDE